MSDLMDEEIRRGLAAEALAYEPPEELAGETLAAAEAAGKPGLRGRFQGMVETWKLRRQRGVPKLAFAGMGLAILLGLYGVGYMSLVSGQNGRALRGSDPAAPFHALNPGADTTDVGGHVDPEAQRSLPQGNADRAISSPECEGGNCAGTAVTGNSTSGSAGDAGTAKSAEGPPQYGGDGGSGGGSVQAQGRPGSPPADSIAPVPVPVPRPGPGAAVGPGVIRTAEMEVRVRKGGFDTAWSRAMSIAGKHGGFVAGSSADQLKGRLSRGTITVRVPAANLDAAVADFQQLGRVMRSTTSSTDVSGQLVDFEARIRAAQAREMQLLELLRQARSVADSLQVSTALSEVRTEIETLQAQKANLQSQVEFAALTVSVYEPEAAPERPRPLDGRLAAAWDRAVDAGAFTLSTIVIGAGFILPLVVLALLVWGGLRLRRRVALR